MALLLRSVLFIYQVNDLKPVTPAAIEVPQLGDTGVDLWLISTQSLQAAQ